jgi:hypothetical protein
MGTCFMGTWTWMEHGEHTASNTIQIKRYNQQTPLIRDKTDGGLVRPEGIARVHRGQLTGYGWLSLVMDPQTLRPAAPAPPLRSEKLTPLRVRWTEEFVSQRSCFRGDCRSASFAGDEWSRRCVGRCLSLPCGVGGDACDLHGREPHRLLPCAGRRDCFLCLHWCSDRWSGFGSCGKRSISLKTSSSFTRFPVGWLSWETDKIHSGSLSRWVTAPPASRRGGTSCLGKVSLSTYFGAFWFSDNWDRALDTHVSGTQLVSSPTRCACPPHCTSSLGGHSRTKSRWCRTMRQPSSTNSLRTSYLCWVCYRGVRLSASCIFASSLCPFTKCRNLSNPLGRSGHWCARLKSSPWPVNMDKHGGWARIEIMIGGARLFSLNWC